MKAYYDRRAPEYDDWYYGQGQHEGAKRPGWEDELAALTESLAELPPARTLDVACGTAFLSRHLAGELHLLDQSARMLEVAARRLPNAVLLEGDALAGLPFEDGSFERIFTGHFYGHLEPDERERFLADARRVARELVVVDSVFRDDVEPESWQERTLVDGTQWQVYKRYFTAEALAQELGGGKTLFEGSWFVAVRS